MVRVVLLADDAKILLERMFDLFTRQNLSLLLVQKSRVYISYIAPYVLSNVVYPSVTSQNEVTVC